MAEDKKLIFKTALIYFQEGRWDKTIAEFKRLVAIDPEDMNARSMLGDAHLKKGQIKEAYEEYVQAAEGYGKKGDGEKANVIYKKMAKLEIKNLDAAQQKKHRIISLVVQGDTAFEEGNYESAVQAYHEVSQLEKGNVEVVAKLAETYARLGKSREAAPQFLAVAKYYQENRLLKRALVFFQKVSELDPSNMEARMELGDLLSREGQELEARKEFESIAEYHVAQGDLRKGQSCAQRAIQLKSIDAHYILGQIYLREEKYDEAKTELEGFLKIKINHPHSIPAQYSLGVCLLKKEQLDDAIATFGKILGKQHDHVDALARMAEIYEKKGATRDAVVQLLSLASVYMGQKIMDRAEETLKKAIAIDPQHLDAHKRMAELFDMRGMKREAANEYLAALKSAKELNVTAEVTACEAKIRAIDPGLLGEGVPPPAPVSAPAAVPPPAAVPVAPSVVARPPSAAPPLVPPVVETPRVEAVFAAPPPPPGIDIPLPAVAAGKPASPVTPAAPAQAAAARTKARITPEQRAQRLKSMAQSAIRQGLFDEALDLLQQAQQATPNDQELKEAIQNALRGFAKGAPGAKKAPAKTAAAAVPATPPPAPAAPPVVQPAAPVAAAGPALAAAGGQAETAEEMERRIRAELEKQYRERAAGRAAESSVEATREHVLAQAAAPEPPAPPGQALPAETPRPRTPPVEAPGPAVPPPVAVPSPAVASAGVPGKPRSRPRVSYV